KVAAILGPTLSAVAAGAHPVAQAASTPVIAISNTGIGIVGKCDYGPCDWIFRASLGEQSAVPETVKAATSKLGLKKIVIIYGNGLNSSALLANANAGLMIVGTAWSRASADKTNTDFIAAYKQAYGKDPDQFAAQSYTAMLALIDAMKRTSRMTDKAQVKTQLEAVSGLATPLGPFSFTPEHDVKQP